MYFKKECDLLEDLEKAGDDAVDILSELDKILQEKDNSIIELQKVFVKFRGSIEGEKILSSTINKLKKNGNELMYRF